MAENLFYNGSNQLENIFSVSESGTSSYIAEVYDGSTKLYDCMNTRLVLNITGVRDSSEKIEIRTRDGSFIKNIPISNNSSGSWYGINWRIDRYTHLYFTITDRPCDVNLSLNRPMTFCANGTANVNLVGTGNTGARNSFPIEIYTKDSAVLTGSLTGYSFFSDSNAGVNSYLAALDSSTINLTLSGCEKDDTTIPHHVYVSGNANSTINMVNGTKFAGSGWSNTQDDDEAGMIYVTDNGTLTLNLSDTANIHAWSGQPANATNGAAQTLTAIICASANATLNVNSSGNSIIKMQQGGNHSTSLITAIKNVGGTVNITTTDNAFIGNENSYGQYLAKTALYNKSGTMNVTTRGNSVIGSAITNMSGSTTYNFAIRNYGTLNLDCYDTSSLRTIYESGSERVGSIDANGQTNVNLYNESYMLVNNCQSSGSGSNGAAIIHTRNNGTTFINQHDNSYVRINNITNATTVGCWIVSNATGTVYWTIGHDAKLYHPMESTTSQNTHWKYCTFGVGQTSGNSFIYVFDNRASEWVSGNMNVGLSTKDANTSAIYYYGVQDNSSSSIPRIFGYGTKAYINNPLTSPLTYEENEMLLVSNSETKNMSRTTNIPTNLLGGKIISGGNTTFSASAGTYRGNSAGGVEIVSKWNLYGILPFGKQNIGELIFTGAGKYNRYTVIDYKYYFKDYTGSTNQ